MFNFFSLFYSWFIGQLGHGMFVTRLNKSAGAIWLELNSLYLFITCPGKNGLTLQYLAFLEPPVRHEWLCFAVPDALRTSLETPCPARNPSLWCSKRINKIGQSLKMRKMKRNTRSCWFNFQVFYRVEPQQSYFNQIFSFVLVLSFSAGCFGTCGPLGFHKFPCCTTTVGLCCSTPLKRRSCGSFRYFSKRSWHRSWIWWSLATKRESRFVCISRGAFCIL